MSRFVRSATVLGATVLLGSLAVSACSSSGAAGGTNGGSASSAPPAVSSAPGTVTSAPATVSSAPAGAKENVAFFGFAKSNSFANATWKGVQQAAAAAGGTATFFDGNFDATTQVSQIEDATVSGKYQVFVVQANDGIAVMPAVRQALAKGIKVVAEYTPIGTMNNTAAPQVPGVISVVEVPTDIGTALGQLAVQACTGLSTCQVAWLVGNPTYPPDTTRLQSALATMGSASNVDVISKTIVGGYTQATGRTAAQNLFTAHKSVNVVIGSSQAIEGAYPVAQQLGIAGKIKFIGNGGSTQAVEGVQSGKWFATIYEDEAHSGAIATQYGIEAAQGKTVPMTTNIQSLAPNNGLGTKAALTGVTASYSD
jgi:ribose transport system substrate-binding protein